jgi:hypothetical protein
MALDMANGSDLRPFLPDGVDCRRLDPGIENAVLAFVSFQGALQNAHGDLFNALSP